MTAPAPIRFAGMELPPELAARAQVTVNSTVGWTIVRGQTPSDFQGTGAEVRRQGWERHPVVMACSRLIVDLISAIRLEVYDESASGETTVRPNHPALGVLRGDHGGPSEFRWKARMGVHLFVYGNAFAALQRRGTRGPPRLIRVIPPEHIAYAWLDPDDDTIRAYDWRDLQGRTHAMEPVENMLHFKDLDAHDGLFGYPRMAAALRSILADNEASEYVREVVTNHGTPGLAILTEGAPPTPAERQAAEQAFNEKWTRRGNRGATAFMAGVKELVPLGFSLNDLEFPDLRRVTGEQMCTAAGVDPRMIGLSSASSDGGLSGEQYREARFRLIQQTVYPIMRLMEDELNHWFMPEFGESKVRFSEDDLAALTEDLTETSTRVIAEVAAKVTTVEEAREAIGRPAEMDPAHTYPGGLKIGEAAQNAQAMQQALLESTKLLGQRDPNAPNGDGAPAPPDDKPPESEDVDKSTARETPRAARITSVSARLLSRGADLGHDAVWRAQDERAKREETGYEVAALRQFAVEREAILREFAALAAAGAAVDDSVVRAALARIEADYAPGGAYHRAWLQRYQTLISRTVQVGGRATAAQVGLSFNLQNPHAQAVIARRAGYLVQHVTETTRDAIRAAVAAGRAQGLGVRQIGQLIEQTTFGEIAKARALTIARTETVGALNAGAYESAVAAGVMQSKTWLSQMDDRVRHTHAAIHGQRVPIDAVFDNGLPYPHADGAPASEVVNCRCSLQFHDEPAPSHA